LWQQSFWLSDCFCYRHGTTRHFACAWRSYICNVLRSLQWYFSSFLWSNW